MSISTTPFTVTTAATTNGGLVAAGSRTLYELTISNPTATVAFVKLYDKATAPTVGTDVPVATIPVAAGALVSLPCGAEGFDVKLGLGRAVTAAMDRTDTAATVAGIVIHGTYA